MTIVSQYINDKNIHIPSEEWKALKDEYTQEQIIDAICDEVLCGNIRLPLREISLDDAKDSFKELCAYQCNDFQVGEVFTRYEYKYPLSGRYIDETAQGNIASDFFQQYNRFCCGSIGAPSPVRTWNNRKFLHGMLCALWSLKCNEVSMSQLRTLLSLRKYIASQYKPAIAKSIYEKYGSRDVLDFSAGWGDRLCGFYAANGTRSYIGIDPNVAVFEKYGEQEKMYGKLTNKKQVTLYNMPAEDVTLPSACVDTVFTSPPYFNLEKYSEDETQSFKRYRKVEDWLQGFMFRTIRMAWRALKPNGYLILNISDVYSNHTINKLCDPTNDFIKSLGGRFIEGIGMRMAKRPNSGALKGRND